MQTSRILVLDSGKIAIIFVLVTASLFLASGPVMYSEAHEALNVLPARSNFDGEIYMRTYLFMREGHGYYDSLLRAIQLDERYSEGFVPGSVLAWRQPALHYIFVLLPSADDIYALYLVLALVAILSSYVVAYRSTGQPLLSAIAPILIANYFASPVLAPRWLVFHEWWGALFLIFALSMVSLGRDSIGVTFLVVAACIREFFFIALLGGLLASFLCRRARPIWASAVVVYAAQYYLHYVSVTSRMPQPYGFNLSLFFTAPTRLLLPASALFAYVQLQHLPLLLAPVIAVLLAVGMYGVFSLGDKMLRTICVALVLIIPSLTLFIGNIYNYYWGATYVPVLLLGVPLGLTKTGLTAGTANAIRRLKAKAKPRWSAT